MYRQVIACTLALCMWQPATAHDMTPTYPKWAPSHIQGVYKTTLELFNKRSDVHWYEIGIFTKDWEPVRFVSRYKIVKLDHLARVKFDVYVNKKDVKSAEYVCSTSKLRENSDKKPMVSSKVCSRFK